MENLQHPPRRHLLLAMAVTTLIMIVLAACGGGSAPPMPDRSVQNELGANMLSTPTGIDITVAIETSICTGSTDTCS
ncbi:hypothetical protein COY28_01940 [Candidatus Woesearchaeota archaeon CG_4_10_14_0_2_um_filter_57_5]|nr:MAG: hypothetical protein AUJ68_04195 [Candidatus Woesearchaeota archaeon CG1_02_57_44]PIN68068.1 MAG: hypothetical protein COV94_06150 [Candidatus Woesearchaeota archaeon CG11_big_fil_rev_8_21_14_0_20_57_5]PIZ55472.1 MAG: hypothetical protein COY28_01940 [Candidatus Woesearchaeota archaeon CG_4_10_14_0_2_um_filter_57_5]